ncbi:MAG: 2Fe-2S iron-sulfur cluster binding domain-containing protein [Kineosporiaceae bacterium]
MSVDAPVTGVPAGGCGGACACGSAVPVHDVTLTTTDGVRIDVACGEDTTVLAAAAGAGYVLPSLCGTGTCGACVATLEAGDADQAPASDAALPPAERERGGVLLCRTSPRSALAVALRCDDSRVLRGGLPRRDAELVAVEPVSADGRSVRVRLALTGEDATAQFEPGQFVEVEVPGVLDPSGEPVRRAYSLSNVANWDGELELLVRLREGGAFSSWLSSAPAGAPLVVHGPQGAFSLAETGLRPRWFVAGGTGLAPILSMLRRMAEWGDPQPVRLYLGVGSAAEVPDLPELHDALAGLTAHAGRALVTSVWRGELPDAAVAGTPLDAVAADLAALTASGAPLPDLYGCGPVALVDGLSVLAAEHGVPGVTVERFVAS